MASLRRTIFARNLPSFNSFNRCPNKVISSAPFSTSTLLPSHPNSSHLHSSPQLSVARFRPPFVSVSSPRAFTTTAASLKGQHFKKAGDVEAAAKAKQDAKWRAPPPPKAKKLNAEEERLAKMTPEQKERWMARKPVDNVWLQRHYPERVFQLEDIVEMNRQANHPSMLDNPDGDLMVELSLNMMGLKLTKPIKSFSVLTHVPFKSPHTTPEPRLIAVLVKNTELQAQMEEKGAAFVGGEDLIIKLKNGILQKDTDYDYLIAHMDIIQELGSQLKKKHAYLMPTEKDGTLGINLMEMFDLHQNGYLLNVKANSDDPTKGSVTFSLGKLSLGYSQMLANLDVIMKILRVKRPDNLTAKRGVFVTGAKVKCSPNSEVLSWDFDALNQFIDDVGLESVFEDPLEMAQSAEN